MGRAALTAHEDFNHGLITLATLASIAPFIGIFGTLCGIGLDTFRGLGTDKYTALAAVAEGLSTACVPAALGLLVGLQSLWCFRYFRRKLAGFDDEMEDASLKLLNQLTLLPRRLSPASPIEPNNQPLPYLEAYSVLADEDHRCARRSALGTVALFATAWCVQVVRCFDYDSLPLASAALTAGQSVLLMFGLACLPAYAVWVDFLHRKASGLAVLAAAFVLCWCVAGLFVPLFKSI